MTDKSGSVPSEGKESSIYVSNVTSITPHNEAMYEAGKSLLVDSVKIGRSFCKFMIGITTGAIPTYLALLKFVLTGRMHVFSMTERLVGAIPPLLFLLASILFVLGFFPNKGQFSLDIVEEIVEQRDSLIRRRENRARWGFAVFCLGVLCAIGILLFVI